MTEELIRKQTVLNMIDNAEFDDLSANTAEQAELFDKLHYAVNSIESVDAVEVVRCRDCKWWRKSARKCAWYSDCHIMIKADDYCSHGERKTDG